MAHPPPSFSVFGGALIDRVGIFRTSFHLGQSHPGYWQQTIGGVASNVARHLANFGSQVTFASVFADDEAALTVLAQLAKDGLTVVPDCTVSESATPTYTVMHDPSGDVIAGLADMDLHAHLNVTWARKTALAGADNTQWIADTNIGAPALTELISLKGSKPLYLVVVSPAKTQDLAALLPNVDGVVCNRQEAEALTNTSLPDAAAAAAALADTGLPFCIVSDGAKESALFRKNPDQAFEIVTRSPTANKADTDETIRQKLRMTGAGDMFAAASLYAICCNSDIAPHKILNIGHAAARLAMLEDDTCPAISWEAISAAAHTESN